jgi:hypothetical protein
MDILPPIGQIGMTIETFSVAYQVEKEKKKINNSGFLGM